MVITVFWTHSWTVPIISVSILCVAVILLIFCLCIQKRRKQLEVSTAPRNKLLNFSNNSLNKLTTFRSYKELYKTKSVSEEKLGSDLDLLDDDSFNGFKSSCLKIDQDDVESCASCDSKYTFYSTYPGVARSASNVSDEATYKSVVCM